MGELNPRGFLACETGDWSRVDVYLAKTTDYRLLRCPGLPWQDERETYLARAGE